MTDYHEITQRMNEINKLRYFEGEALNQLRNYKKIKAIAVQTEVNFVRHI